MAISADKFELHLVGYMPSLTKDGDQVPVFRLTTADTSAVVFTANYFNTEVKRMPVGTRIECNTSMSGTPAFKIAMVTANDGATVTVVKQLLA